MEQLGKLVVSLEIVVPMQRPQGIADERMKTITIYQQQHVMREDAQNKADRIASNNPDIRGMMTATWSYSERLIVER